MPADYKIDFQPLDLSNAARFLLGVENEKTQRMFAERNNRVQAASELRAQQEEADRHEREKRKQEIEAAGQIPMLMRAARNLGPDVASQMGKPYGIGFASQPATHVTSDLFGAANNAYGKVAEDALAAPPPEAPVPMGQHSGTPMMPEQPPEQGPDVVAQESARLAAAKPGLAMLIGGKNIPVPEHEEKSGFGPEYDDLYRALLDQGEKPNDALRLVAAKAKADMGQQGLDARQAASIASREGEDAKYRMTVEEQFQKQQNQIDAMLKAAGINAHSRVAAAVPGAKQEGVNDRIYGLLERRAKAVRDTTQFTKLVQGDKTVRGLMLNIASGAVPLQHSDAQIQLARYFRQAQPTEGEMHLLYNNLGGTMDSWNRFIAHLTTGDLDAEQMRQLQTAAHAVKRENDEDKKRFTAVAKKMLGPGSGLDMVPDQAQNYYEAMAAELGLEGLPPLYETQGGVTLGTGKAPSVKPRSKNNKALDDIEAELDSLGGK